MVSSILIIVGAQDLMTVACHFWLSGKCSFISLLLIPTGNLFHQTHLDGQANSMDPVLVLCFSFHNDMMGELLSDG